MACQAIVTQYILPLNQKCVCLEASHWQMPNLEAFPPLPCLTPHPPEPLLYSLHPESSLGHENLGLPSSWAVSASGKKLDVHLAPAVCQLPLWVYQCIYSSELFAVAPFREQKDEERDGIRLSEVHGPCSV